MLWFLEDGLIFLFHKNVFANYIRYHLMHKLAFFFKLSISVCFQFSLIVLPLPSPPCQDFSLNKFSLVHIINFLCLFPFSFVHFFILAEYVPSNFYCLEIFTLSCYSRFELNSTHVFNACCSCTENLSSTYQSILCIWLIHVTCICIMLSTSLSRFRFKFHVPNV